MSDNENIKKLEEIISSQTKGHEGTAVEGVGHQLLDMAGQDPACAEILIKDLEVSGMGIEDAEREIKKTADEKHKKGKGNSVWISPKEADGILRKFYGLPEVTPVPASAQRSEPEVAEDEIDILGMLLEG